MEVESCRRASHLRGELAHDFFAVYGQPVDLDLNILIPMLSNALQGYPKSPPKASSCARRCFNGLPTLCGLFLVEHVASMRVSKVLFGRRMVDFISATCHGGGSQFLKNLKIAYSNKMQAA